MSYWSIGLIFCRNMVMDSLQGQLKMVWLRSFFIELFEQNYSKMHSVSHNVVKKKRGHAENPFSNRDALLALHNNWLSSLVWRLVLFCTRDETLSEYDIPDIVNRCQTIILTLLASVNGQLTKIMNYGLTHLMVRIYKFVWIYRIIYIVWCLVLFCTCDETWHDTQDVSSILWFQFSMCKHPQYVSVFYCVSFRPTRAQREELPFSVSKKRPLKIMKMMIRMLKSVMLLQGHTTTEMMLPPWRITSIC